MSGAKPMPSDCASCDALWAGGFCGADAAHRNVGGTEIPEWCPKRRPAPRGITLPLRFTAKEPPGLEVARVAEKHVGDAVAAFFAAVSCGRRMARANIMRALEGAYQALLHERDAETRAEREKGEKR